MVFSRMWAFWAVTSVLGIGCAKVQTDITSVGMTTDAAVETPTIPDATTRTVDVPSIEIIPRGTSDSGLPDDAGAVSAACSHDLHPVIRDFRGYDSADGARHPDFEGTFNGYKGIVESIVGTDHKPVYAPAGATPATTGRTAFDQWYRDVEGINLRFDDVVLSLNEDPTRPGTFIYDNQMYFPIDGRGWKDCSYCTNNFHFTTEIHLQFIYRGGETFTFRGDDDVFVFLNGHLGIDLGGVHPAETGTIDLDAQSSDLGITKGHTYQMDIFQAERHTTESTFRIETTLGCVTNIVIP